MSELSGYIILNHLRRKGDETADPQRDSSYHPTTRDSDVRSEALTVKVSGHPLTHSIHEDGSSGTVVVGLPLETTGATTERIGYTGRSSNAPDGHFVKLVWSPTTITISTDRLGVRACYYAVQNGKAFFSTDLAKICQYTGHSEINMSAFSSHWLGINQLSHECLVNGIERLSPGETVSFSAEGVKRSTYSAPQSTTTGVGPSSSFLQAVIPFLQVGGFKTSLGLSGGLDSRTLLALLLQNKIDFQLHSFGSPLDGDNQLSVRIADELGIPRVVLPESIETGDSAMNLMRGFASAHGAIAPASAGLKLNRYKSLADSGNGIIDGGFGEIGRARFAKRLRHPLLRSLTHVTQLHLERAFRYDKTNPFTEPVAKRLRHEYRKTVRLVREEMLIDNREWDNVIDQIMVTYRLPNFYAYGQAAIDAVSVGWMPFAQPTYIDAVLAASAESRRDSAAYKSAIQSAEMDLDSFPLAKGARLTTFDGQATSPKTSTNTKTSLLASVEEQVRDLVRSTAVRNYSWYDCPRLIRTVDAFYGGDESLEREVDWWLAFELWRQSLHS